MSLSAACNFTASASTVSATGTLYAAAGTLCTLALVDSTSVYHGDAQIDCDLIPEAGQQFRLNPHGWSAKFQLPPIDTVLDVTITVSDVNGSTAQSQFSLVVVKDGLLAATLFGADPTGSVDSLAAVNAASTALTGTGVRPFFPAGTYNLSAPPTVPIDVRPIIGAGANFTGAGGPTMAAYGQAQHGSRVAPIDVATLSRADLSDPTWAIVVPSQAPKVAQLDEANGSYLDGCLVNPYGDAPAQACFASYVVAPPGTTALTHTRSLKTSATLGNPAATVVLAIYDSTGATKLASTACVLTSTATSYSVTYSSAVAGTEYQVRVLVNDTGNGTSAQAQFEDLGGATTATGATGLLAAPYVRMHLLPGAFQHNIEKANGAWLRGYITSPMARVALDTDASEIVVEAFSEMGNARAGDLLVLVNGRPYQALAFSASTACTMFTVALPGGRKRVEIQTGANQTPATSPSGSFLRAIYAAATDVLHLIDAPPPGRRMLIDGDSISCGYDATYPTRRGYAPRMRQTYGNIALAGYSGRQLTDDYSTATSRTAEASKIAVYRPDDIIEALGTNDWGNATATAANFGTDYAAALDALHAALPGATVYALTPIQRVSEQTPNTNGDKLSAFRNQIATAVSSRAWAALIPGPDIITQADVDGGGIHPTDNGHDKIARYLLGTLGYGAAAVSAWSNPVATGLIDEWLADQRVTLDGSGNVQSWAGLNGNAFAQATAADRPAYTKILGQNGLAAVQPNGSSTFLSIASALLGAASPWTIAMVLQSNSTYASTLGVPFYCGNGSNGVALEYSSGSRVVGYTGGQNLSDGATTTNPEIWIVTNDGTTTKLYVDGASQSLTNSTSQPVGMTGSTYVGAFSSGFYFGGNVQYLGLWSVALSAGNVATLNTALDNRYGI